MKVAALDLGTNTFILLIAEVRFDGENVSAHELTPEKENNSTLDLRHAQIERVLHDEMRVIRLGQGVNETGRFHPEALSRAETCLHDYAEIIAKNGVARVLACATSAARDVQNKEDLFAIATRNRLPLEIISGEEEAELTFAGTLKVPLTGPTLVIDVGGGSTEFILGDDRGIKKRQSLNIGAVRLTEKFVTAHPVPENEMRELRHAIANAIQDLRQ